MQYFSLLKKRAVGLFLLHFIFSCNTKSDSSQEGGLGNEQPKITLQINSNKSYQTIDNFGASDAWACQFVGQWPDQKREKIADLLFSKELDGEGSPKGIGLSLWRFNIGAGSAEQGSESGIGDEWRRAESFLELDGTYNWDRQKGQVWFANAAKERGVGKLLLFPNSPHVNFTKNGKAYSSDGKSNLAADKYPDFAEYLANVVQGLENKGLTVDYVSPINEPQWDWSKGNQEGCPYWNNEIADFVKVLNKEFEEKAISAKIDIAEAGQIDYLYEQGNRPGRSNQITDFFDESSENYVGDLSHVGNVISGHSYFTTSPNTKSVEKRAALANSVRSVPKLKFWMSEYCILGGNDGEINGNGRDLGIDPALYVAKVIHNDLVVANATAWQWWLAVSPYNYKDGLVYVDYQKEDGEVYESKILWALGNFSRFVRPGFNRIDIAQSSGHPNENLLCSGYKSPDTGELTIVLVNSDSKAFSINLELDKQAVAASKAYLTSKDKDLEQVGLVDASSIELPPRSVMTIVLNP
ncbi:glycoside hydrolase [Flammeovirgaceae bacterium SG7u.111]|nr:glycoside hydrolase [Flammeovirgaceae bacterium SG7u.132]WPO33139.1 glycoside hydrolase [Flammeovirgaceae bacterium SG7u.111]